MPALLLLSTPWPLFHRPSIQLGTLKAYVRKNLPRVRVEAQHLFLEVAAALGYDLYKEISESTWLSESPYAALLFPDQGETIEHFWKRRCAALPHARKVDFPGLCEKLKGVSETLLDRIVQGEPLLAGLSICFGQLTSTLYFAREIKRRAPTLKIVVGGPSCAGRLGETLLETFPEIDFVIRGEGERPLVGLLKELATTRQDADPRGIPGVLFREHCSDTEKWDQIAFLEDLPVPDYTDYFHALRNLGSEKAFIPMIPMEASRGCWWRKALSKNGPGGCAFCNLNLQWEGYRSKGAEQLTREIAHLSERHESLSVSFVDNLLPARDLEPLFRSIREMKQDFQLFAEIRADTPLSVLSNMGASGMREVQVGIEALSTGLLRKLNKGTTAIDNIEIMKNCEIPGFPALAGNLILDFPSSEEADATETLRNLEYTLPFRPLKAAAFWLGFGSPVHCEPVRFGIRGTGNHPSYGSLFPRQILGRLELMIQGYRGGRPYQRRLWSPVREKMKQWERSYTELHSMAPGGRRPFRWEPILSYVDGGTFLIIRERRLKASDMNHRVRGTSRRIYLFCESQRPLSEILSRFPGLGAEKLLPFLRMMVEKRLMFREGERYLSLAVPLQGKKQGEV